MAVKTLMTALTSYTKEPSLRSDFDFTQHHYNSGIDDYYTFNDLFEIKQLNAVPLDDLDEFEYVEIGDTDKNGDIEPVSLNVSERNAVTEDYFKKIEKGDIIKTEPNTVLVSSVRPNLKKIIFIDDLKSKPYYTKAFLQLTPRKCPKVLYYALRTAFFNELISVSRRGKGYPTIKYQDLQSMRFDRRVMDYLLENEIEILQQIEIHEDSIKIAKAQIVNPVEIIDDVFAREFNFDANKIEQLNKTKSYSIKLNKFADNIDIRNSYRFNSPSAVYTLSFLKSITNKSIKHFLETDIELGDSISPADITEEATNLFYASMATIKRYRFDVLSASAVSEEYFVDHQSKTIQAGDILLARSGEGTIGKVAHIDHAVDAVFADFTMRIRLKAYNTKFAYYYFRTTVFQNLVDSYKKGLGNNTNIFPIQVKDFPLLDIGKDKQDEVVAEINAAMVVIDEAVTKVEELNQQIEQLFISAI
jgi:type I restriction enzyme, S subunit